MKEILSLFLEDLNDRGASLPNPQAFYDKGVFTGVMNRLDLHSPHVCTNTKEALKWYHEGLRLIALEPQS